VLPCAKGAPKPDISSVDAFRRTLLAAKAVAYPGKGASGLYFVSLLDRMGIKSEMQVKLKPMEAEDTVEVVARGDADLVVVVATRIMDVGGVDMVGPIPEELQTKIGFAAGLSSSAKEPDAAKSLIRFMTAPSAAATLRAKGVDPI
jgi:molybdate transport system substrate-binding protein